MNLDKLDSNTSLDYLNPLKSPVNKETCVYIDPFEVLNSKYYKVSSATNTIVDTTSTKLDDESTKSIYSGEQVVKVKTLEIEEEKVVNQNLTLSEIISKKKRQSTIKENKKRCVALNIDGKKKRKRSIPKIPLNLQHLMIINQKL